MEFTEKDKEKIVFILTDKLGLHEDDIEPTSNLANDLGTDDLDGVELMMEFEKEFDINIQDDQWCEVQTVQDIYNLIENFKK